jgi:long-chain acyl-CoA synthetase
MNIAQGVLQRGQDRAVAVFYKDSKLTYAELRKQVAACAAELSARGHVKGDRIGIWSENSPSCVVAYLGIILAGLVAVPFETESSAVTFESIVREVGIQDMFVSKRFFNRVRPWASRLGITLLPLSVKESTLAQEAVLSPKGLAHEVDGRGNGGFSLAESGKAKTALLGDGAVHASAELTPRIDSAQDLAALMFTSGSTGAPKGVMVSHWNIEANTRDIVSYMGLTEQDRGMVVLPFHYCFGLSLLHSLLMAGGSLVLNNDFKLFPESVLLEMQQRECTGLAGVPSTYQILLRRSRFRQMAFPKLRWLQQAGGKLPNPFISEIISSFPQVRYFLMYGQTEATARLSYLPPERLKDKLGSVGKGLPSTKLEVVRPDGSPVLPGSEEMGEIVASGDNIALGYWNDPQETGKYFRNGRLHTGDLARVDNDGFIYIVERERELIKSGGNRVSAKEVEGIIAEIPEVVEVAVVGITHELLGEAIRAFVTTVPGSHLGPKDVECHCHRRLPAFKNPAEIVLLKSMPHNSAGKILKQKLKEMAGSGQGSSAGRELSPA